MTSTGWRDEKYREVFESVLRGLERRRASDRGFFLADAEGTLGHLYVQEGNDWGGRGELQDISLGATIAAYEYFIDEWRTEVSGTPPPNTKDPHDKEQRMSIEIKRVETARDLKTFIRFPLRVYAGNPYYVPALDFDDTATLRKDKNPAFEYCEAEYWLAYRDGKPVGRIAGIYNKRYVEKWGNKYLRFGWIDFVEDFEVAQALMRTVEDWAKSKGMEGVHGPLGFTDLDREGMLVEGFDQVATLATTYNHAYYPQYLERLGYAKDIDWIEFQVKVPDSIPEKVLRVQDLIAKRSGVHLFPWKTKREILKYFAEDIFSLLEEAYAHLYGTTPLTERQVKNYIDTYLGFVDPRFTKILVDEHEKLIGFGISMPSLSAALRKSKGSLLPFGWLRLLLALRHPKVIDMYLVAVKPEYQARGVIAFLMTSLNRSAIEEGVEYAESNPELETNVEVQGLWKGYDRRQHKRRRVYLKHL